MEQILETLESFPKNLDRPKEIDKLRDDGFGLFLKMIADENLERKNKI